MNASPRGQQSFAAEASPRYGNANPERVETGVLASSIKHHWSAARLREHLGVAAERHPSHQNVGHSAHRDTMPGPVWGWQRVGRTSTPLLDGRIVHVAGSQEDFYDPDFCIYNDVVVEHPDGRAELFLYPCDVFPPTDFHSATLVGAEIILIGSLGYADRRRPGETQILRLDTNTFRVDRIQATGSGPGWIAHHAADRSSDTAIRITGGTTQTSHGAVTNGGTFTLDLAALKWRHEETEPAAEPAVDRDELAAIEVELALADEQYPLDMRSLRLITFFERNAAGNWTCIRPIAVAGPDGKAILIRPRQTFARGMSLAGIDFYEQLQVIAWRSDRA